MDLKVLGAMAVDYAAKEREFLDSLEADTGKGLADWMTAISAAQLAHRNDIIDWLRRQGFTFSRASWLERIHHNGGRPIYADKPAASLRAALKEARAVRRAAPARRAEPRPETAPPPRMQAPEPAKLPATLELREPDLEALLVKAKAYGPLARHLLEEIRRVLPGARFAPKTNHVEIGNPNVFAVLAVSPRELRLGLDLGDRPVAPPLQKLRIAGAPQRMSHGIVLTDARQVGDELLSLLEAADARTKGLG